MGNIKCKDAEVKVENGTDKSQNGVEGSKNDTLDAAKSENAEERGKFLYNLFMNSYGLSSGQSLGVVSALYKASEGWNPKKKTSDSLGFCQWSLKKQCKLVSEYINNEFHKSYTYDTITAATFNEQLSYMKKELSGDKSCAISEVKKCNDETTSCMTFAATYLLSEYKTLEEYQKKVKKSTADKKLKSYTDVINNVKKKIGI